MNALITRSNEARAQLMAATGMDELDYHLLILESGCQVLDELVRPVGTISKAACDAYRDHLGAIGWWNFYEYAFRALEIRLAAEWTGPESLVPHQPAEWCRKTLMMEAYSFRYTAQFGRALDAWLSGVESRLALHLPAVQPQQQPKQTPTHVH